MNAAIQPRYTPSDVMMAAYGFEPNRSQAGVFSADAGRRRGPVGVVEGKTTAALCLLLSAASTHPRSFVAGVSPDPDGRLAMLQGLARGAERLGLLAEVRLRERDVRLTNDSLITCYASDIRHALGPFPDKVVVDGADRLTESGRDFVAHLARRARAVLLP